MFFLYDTIIVILYLDLGPNESFFQLILNYTDASSKLMVPRTWVIVEATVQLL